MYLAKMTFNENQWIHPSGRNKKRVSNNFVQFYEDTYGFGWEEWNFSPLRVKNNFHYGFLQAIHSNIELRNKTYCDVILFTQILNSFYIIGFIQKLYALSFNESRIAREELSHENLMKEDIIKVKGNLIQFQNDFNSSVNCKFENYKYILNIENLERTKFNPDSKQNSFKDLFEVKNEKKIEKINKIISQI
jgi:hypothetical protein